MHLSVRTSHLLEEAEPPLNPEQTPADILVLSFTDSDLACFAEAAKDGAFPSLRLTSLARMKHPLSVDLYIEQVASHAKVILARVLGGYDWWRYGVEELRRIAIEKNIALALLPGDGRTDARLTALSTIAPETLSALDACLSQGGVENARRALTCLAGGGTPVPLPVESGMFYREAVPARPQGRATLIFYRAHMLSADTAPVDALTETLATRGLHVRAFMITSHKDPAAQAALREEVRTHPPDILIDATAFAAGEQAHPMAHLDVPILQVALAGAMREAWEASTRGLGSTDLAMHVVLPEADGRIFTRAISFKAEAERDDALEFSRTIHAPEPNRLAYVAELAAAWVRLAKTPQRERRIALILSDYPGRPGRNAYAVGLDAPQSALEILRLLKNDDYALDDLPETVNALLKTLQGTRETYPLANYRTRLETLPAQAREALHAAWGEPEADPSYHNGAFHLPILRSGNACIAFQPDRGDTLDRKAGYHNPVTPPRHGYLAFYWWLREQALMNALIHLGTHGNLEWLPGKTAALSSACWPEIVMGATPVIYPYIVSDPGEAAQAKRRISAVMLSHLTPPLADVTLSPELAELERLSDEYAGADGLDPRRMHLLRAEILERAASLGTADRDADAVMATLEEQLCDIKEQRVADGLHIFGHHAPQESANLLRALNGRFIPPSPGGSPSRGRMDVLPTGRNIFALDPRAIPTQTASAMGKQAASEFVRRYTQDHGEWPKRVVMDLWGSACLRTGGDDIAQALYLMGVTPLWDTASQRVSGFDILPPDTLPWPRIDVSLRISGLFRDMFPGVIALFDDAVRTVAALDEVDETNPLAGARRAGEPLWRVFGAAPGAYGAGVTELIDSGRWETRAELGRAYLNASAYAYGRDMDGTAQPQAIARAVQTADAFMHVQDQRETDILSGADFADTEGGFASAAHMLGAEVALYHMDTSRPHAPKTRTLAEEVSLTLHARALNPAWLAGQMRHGYAGASALADAADQLFTFAATTDAVVPRQFDALFDAYLHDEKIHIFLRENNLQALRAIAARFAEAVQRGLWSPRRNSAHTLLDNLLHGKEAA